MPFSNMFLRVTIETSTTAGRLDRFINRFHYRSTDVWSPFGVANVLAQFRLKDWRTHWWEPMANTYYLSKITAQVLANPGVEPYAEDSMGWAEPNDIEEGTVTTFATGFNPAVCAVITRKSYRGGRRGRGATYYGPIGGPYVNSGFLNPAPGLGYASLAGVLDFCSESLELGEAQWKPCIIPAWPAPTGSLASDRALHDQRAAYFAPLVVEHMTRRTGRGM